MLAADHRWQWEEFCDARSIPRTRIPEVKRLAYDGFLLRAHRVRGRARIRRAADRRAVRVRGHRRRRCSAGVTVGTPAEKAGAFPLAWSTDPFSAALTGAFVKVLARYRPDDEEACVGEQWAKLDALQAWCRGAGKPLVIEVLVARRQEPEDEFEASGRPAMLAGFIAEAYRRGLTPDSGKSKARSRREGARTIDAAIAANPACRQIILGKAADLVTIDRWFAAARRQPTAVGFAIGRSVFWEPSAAFLRGRRRPNRQRRHLPRTTCTVAAWDAVGRT